MSGHISFKVKGFNRDTVEVNLMVDTAQQGVDAYRDWSAVFEAEIGNGTKPKSAASKKEAAPKVEKAVETVAAVPPVIEPEPEPPAPEHPPQPVAEVTPEPETAAEKPSPHAAHKSKLLALPSPVYTLAVQTVQDLIFIVPEFRKKQANEVAQMLVPSDIDGDFTDAMAAEVARKALDAINVYCAAPENDLSRRYFEAIGKLRECTSLTQLEQAKAEIVSLGHPKKLSSDERLFPAFRALGEEITKKLTAEAETKRPALVANDVPPPKTAAPKNQSKPPASSAALAAMDLIDVA